MKDIRVNVREIEKGDEILINDRSWPIEAKCDAKHVREMEGQIHVLWRAYLKGPEGADAELELTRTGRVRWKPGRYCPPENVYRLVRYDET